MFFSLLVRLGREHEWSQHAQVLIQVVLVGMQRTVVVLQGTHFDPRVFAHAHFEAVQLVGFGNLHDDRGNVFVEAGRYDLETFINAEIVIVDPQLVFKVSLELFFLSFSHF